MTDLSPNSENSGTCCSIGQSVSVALPDYSTTTGTVAWAAADAALVATTW